MPLKYLQNALSNVFNAFGRIFQSIRVTSNLSILLEGILEKAVVYIVNTYFRNAAYPLMQREGSK